MPKRRFSKSAFHGFSTPTTRVEPRPAGVEKAIFLSDLQIPFHDQRALGAVAEFMAAWKPDIIIYGGDVLDLPGFSLKYAKHPDFNEGLIESFYTAIDLFKEHKAAHPAARQVWIEGNHEARLEAYIYNQAPALTQLAQTGGLDARSMTKFAGEYVGPYDTAWDYRGFRFKHGTAYGKYPAHRELDFEWTSGMSGHANKMQMAHHTTAKGPHVWWSVGCLCNIEGKNVPPGFRSGTGQRKDWAQGFGTVTFFPDRSFAAQGLFIHRGRIYLP